jgi:iron complex outermembrane receptor protein
VDKASREPLSFSTLQIQEDRTKGAISDVHGNFIIPNLCPGEYHVEISYIGYESQTEYIELGENVVVEFKLGEYNELLNEIVVHGDKSEKTTEAHHVVDQESIRRKGNKNLADVLEGISGVSVLRTGSGVSKPIIHGLYGNRVTILNNGIIQAGQQWGNDHAPEIDPFVADHISVVKGAGALQYGSSAIGGVVMVDPYRIKKDPHLHGKATYVFQSNGLGSTLNTQIERSDKWAAWRISGTVKYIGDNRAPSYYLTNTGHREANFSAQLERSFGKKWFTSAYYSLFNSSIGILRGSHISNLSDLEEAIGRDKPFFTKDEFSYTIESPSQRVNHHLFKLETEYFIAENQLLTFRYGGQLDNRKEFDVRRGGRSDLPALSLQLYSHNFDALYDFDYSDNGNLKFGVQSIYTNNTNLPETGILPLIPDYQSLMLSGFAIWQLNRNSWLFEAATRYDFRDLEVVAISRTLPREIERYYRKFNNYGANMGLKKAFSQVLNLSLNLSYAQRSPEVNELYSYGLHQGVSGIEEGSPDLVPENSMKTVLSVDWKASKKLYFQALGYYQDIRDYIFLEPQDEFRLTIRGAFPVFIYKQTDAHIYGLDLTMAYNISNNFTTNVVYAMVRGQDVTNNTPLVYIPADNITASFTYKPENGVRFLDNKVGLEGRYVFEQSRLMLEQDFLPPPEGYFLLSLNAGTGFQLGESHLDLNLKVENMLNIEYRDYLNRLRYFADEMGINVIVGLNLTF